MRPALLPDQRNATNRLGCSILRRPPAARRAARAAKKMNPGSVSNETMTGSQASGDTSCVSVARNVSSVPGDMEAHDPASGVITTASAAIDLVASSTAMMTATERQIIDSNRKSALNMSEPSGFQAAAKGNYLRQEIGVQKCLGNPRRPIKALQPTVRGFRPSDHSGKSAEIGQAPQSCRKSIN